jgi:hypothetical protein
MLFRGKLKFVDRLNFADPVCPLWKAERAMLDGNKWRFPDPHLIGISSVPL